MSDTELIDGAASLVGAAVVGLRVGRGVRSKMPASISFGSLQQFQQALAIWSGWFTYRSWHIRLFDMTGSQQPPALQKRLVFGKMVQSMGG